MTTRTIIDEDICAGCANCCLLEPPRVQGGRMWEAKALCIAGWPFTRWCIEANCASECPRFEKKVTA